MSVEATIGRTIITAVLDWLIEQFGPEKSLADIKVARTACPGVPTPGPTDRVLADIDAAMPDGQGDQERMYIALARVLHAKGRDVVDLAKRTVEQ